MKENPFSPNGLRGCLVNLISTILALGAMILSAGYQYPEHPLCGGGLGAGFPFLFICDAGLGGSPISSWGKITFVDIPNGGIRPGGFLLDFLFYFLLIWLVWLGAAWVFNKPIRRRDLSWAAFISVVYITGLLCGSLVFFSSELYDKGYARTPTSSPIMIPSGTPFGTMPSLIPAVPTVGP